MRITTQTCGKPRTIVIEDDSELNEISMTGNFGPTLIKVFPSKKRCMQYLGKETMSIVWSKKQKI